MQDITASLMRENYNKVKGTQFLSWVSLSHSLLIEVNIINKGHQVNDVLCYVQAYMNGK